MANYTTVTVSNYNSSPPSDDGSTDSTNRITWSGIKTKLTDPLNTAIASINSNIITAGGIWDQAAPQGTNGLFQQTSATSGWTKVTTYNDRALRVVSGTASTGGSTAFTSVFTSRTISSANLPSISLASLTGSVGTTITNGTSVIRGSTNGTNDGTGASVTTLTGASSATLSLASGTVTFGGSLGGSSTAMDFAVQYVDIIIATKN